MKSYKVAGIITEYNPFHNGHIYHIQETKRITNCDILVCVMSGNFVQRGESAIIDKWERTKLALEHGVDIVIELPFIYATQSANYFAQGAIACLQLAEVDCIVFGSESNDIHALQTFAAKEISLQNEKKRGISSSLAYANVYGSLSPNDILGLNYIRHIEKTNINAYTIQRSNAYHSKALQGKISSASAIREAVFKKQAYSETTPMILDDTHQFKNYYPYIRYKLLSTPKEQLASIFLVDEGIEHRFIKHAQQSDSYDTFLEKTLTKRYTKANIQRSLVHILNHTTKEQANTLPEMKHIRVLGFNQEGQNYLHHLKKNVLIVTQLSKLPSPFNEMEVKASFLYNTVLPLKKQAEANKKELQAPIIHTHTEQ